MGLTKLQTEALSTLVNDKIAACEKRKADLVQTYKDRTDDMLLEYYTHEIIFWNNIRQKVEEGL